MPLSTSQYGFIIDPMVPFTDASGTTIRNGYVRVFVAGSSTPVITYKNYDGATNEETIQLDNSGRTAYPVIVSKGNTYKVCVYDAEHSQESPILTIDKVVPAGANVEATNIVTGLDNVESPEAGWVKSTVSGTDAEVSLDATNVTSEVDTMVKATAASADYMMPLVHKTGSDPDKKITLGNIFKFVLNFIHSLTDTATESDIASGNYFALDGSAGTKKLNSTTLLTKTAQNALAGNVAPAFDATKPNDVGGYAYYAGEIVAYNGATYRFKANHSSGAWNASQVESYNLINEISKNQGSFISSFACDTPQTAALKSDGTINTTIISGWKTFYKVPVKQGDVLELKNIVQPTSEGYANVAIYATDGTLLEHYECSNFFRKFEQDGFVSVMSSSLTDFTKCVKFSPVKLIGTIFYNQALNFKNFSEDERTALYEMPCLLKNDGTLLISSIAKTLYKVHVKKGCKIIVGNSGSFSGAYASFVFYDNSGNVIYNHTTATYTYIVPSDGFVSISYRIASTNFFVHFEDSAGVFEVADLSVRNENNLSQQKDLTLEVLKNCLKIGAVKIDGTFVSIPSSVWQAIYKFPLKKGGILCAKNLGLNIVSPPYASYVVTDLSGNVIDYGVSSDFFLEASQDCFVSLTGSGIFNYLNDVVVGLSDFYTFSQFVTSILKENENYQKEYIYSSIAQVLKKCTFIGDSITCGFIRSDDVYVDGETAKALKQNWAEYLCLGKGMTCTNIAVSGSSTHDWRYGRTIVGVPVSIDNANIPTDAYFVALGVNDKRVPLTLGSSSDIESDYEDNADSMYGNYDYIVRKIHSFNPYAKIFVLTTGANESGMNSYNEAIRYVAGLYDYVYLIDLWNEEFFSSSFCSNNLWINGHFTPVGESCLSQIVWKKLNELIYENISSMTYIPYYPGM